MVITKERLEMPWVQSRSGSIRLRMDIWGLLPFPPLCNHEQVFSVPVFPCLPKEDSYHSHSMVLDLKVLFQLRDIWNPIWVQIPDVPLISCVSLGNCPTSRSPVPLSFKIGLVRPTLQDC